jgi:O-antigen/teichoic acid export membrane protein
VVNPIIIAQSGESEPAAATSASFWRDTVIISSLRITAIGLTAVGNFWVARELGPTKIGISAMVTGVVIPLVLLVNMNQQALQVREYKVAKEEVKLGVISSILSLRLIGTAGAAVAAMFFGLLVGIPPGFHLAIGGGAIFFLAQVISPFWLFQATDRLQAFTALNVLQGIILGTVYLALIRQGTATGTDLLLQGVIALLVSIAGWWLVLRQWPGAWFQNLRFDLRAALAIFRRGQWLFLCGITIYIYTTVEQPLLGWLTSLDELGIYRVATLAAGAGAIVTGVVQQLLFPRLVDLYNEDRRRLWQFQKRLCLRSSGFLAGGLLLGSAAIWYLLPLIVGASYAPARGPAIILLTAKALVFLNGIFGWGLWANAANDKSMALVMLSVAALSLSCNILLLPRFGMHAAAWINLASETMILIATAAMCKARFSPSPTRPVVP